ncbi:hypothetical protein BSL78_11217 [Apostichopus japonicus]|uniref:Activating signal cointegrator 1 N-terminal domain-containing protein n=1 Tax=Stichopus japonicus TaxID=307972 RepID=A0A2G8KV71_STIJA|nr:hypothetical protein BSL78_11217 [Apostichopus japonicus]
MFIPDNSTNRSSVQVTEFSKTAKTCLWNSGVHKNLELLWVMKHRMILSSGVTSVSSGKQVFIKYLIAIEDEEEVEDYVQDLVGANSPRVAAFIKELLSKKKLHPGTEGTEVLQKQDETRDPFDDVLQSVRPKQKKQAMKANSKKVV